jgi:hypothetical protein
MRLLLPVLLMLPMAQTIDDKQLYYDHDRDLDYKISKSQQVSTLRSNNLRIARETRPVEHRQKLGMIIRMGTSIKAVKAGKVLLIAFQRGLRLFGFLSLFFLSRAFAMARLFLFTNWSFSFLC